MTKPVIPQTSAELEEMLNDANRMQDVFADQNTFKTFIRNYAKSTMDKDASIAAQVKEQTQAILAEFLREHPDGNKSELLDLSPLNGSPKYSPIHNKRAIGAPLDKVFSDVGEFFAAAWHKGSPKGDLAKKLEVLNAYQEKVPAEGGFLVPEEFRAELLRLTLERSVVRPRARVIPMAAPTLRFPAIDETSHASNVYGGITVYRTEEGAALTESAATFASVKLDVTKQTALAHVTNELVTDAAGGFAAWITDMFPQALAFFEDADFLGGSGVGEPLGALTSANAARILQPRTTANKIAWADIVRMYARMLPSSLSNAAWVVSQEALPELFQMTVNVRNAADTDNVGGSAVYISDGVGAPTLTLLGRPVIVTEKASQLGSSGDVNFVDFGYYLIGDRQMMTIDSSPHVRFTQDQTTYRVIQRTDGRPWIQSALTPYNGGDTLSPFVSLKAETS